MSRLPESGNSQEGALALANRLRILRHAYQSGFFTEPTTLPLPEIVADGHGPDDWLGSSPEGALSTRGSCQREAVFRVAPDLRGRPFCGRCGVLHHSFIGPCPVCGNP